MATTLAESLKPASVDWDTLHSNYNPLLNLVRELIGIIPNCDPTLEIWPPGFRTYNLLVPNMFNLPGSKKSHCASKYSFLIFRVCQRKVFQSIFY